MTRITPAHPSTTQRPQSKTAHPAVVPHAEGAVLAEIKPIDCSLEASPLEVKPNLLPTTQSQATPTSNNNSAQPEGGTHAVSLQAPASMDVAQAHRSDSLGFTHAQWPNERFYWSIVRDPQALAAAQRLSWASRVNGVRIVPPRAMHALAFAVEPDLPLPWSQVYGRGLLVHAHRGSDGEGRPSGTAPQHCLIVCAVSRDMLDRVLEGTLSLTPRSLPSWMSEAKVTGEANTTAITSLLNLLVDEYEPTPLRAARTRLWTIATAAACIGLLVMSLGLWRRAQSWDNDAAAHRQATTKLIADRFGVAGSVAPLPNGAEALKRLMAQQTDAKALDSLRLSSTYEARADAATTLASLLKLWPTLSHEGRSESENGHAVVQTESLSVTDTSISATVLLTTDARIFTDRLAAPPGWKLEQTRLSQSQSGVRLMIQMVRVPAMPLSQTQMPNPSMPMQPGLKEAQ
jgi:hypothetical protein